MQHSSCGFAVDPGFAFSRLFVEDYARPHDFIRINLAGRAVTSFAMEMLTERRHFFNTTADPESVRDTNETLIYYALDLAGKMQAAA